MPPDGSSLKRMTPSFSERSCSKTPRAVPRKYVENNAYIASRSATVVCDTTEPASRRSPFVSQRGDVDVNGTLIELLIEMTSVGPRSEIKPAWIEKMRIGARDRQQRIARIEADEQVIEPASGGQVVDLAQQASEDGCVVIRHADQCCVGAAYLVAHARKHPGDGFHPTGVAAYDRLLVRRLVPQRGDADDRSAAPGDAYVLRRQSECSEIAERLLCPDGKELATGPVVSEEFHDLRNLVGGSRHDVFAVLYMAFLHRDRQRAIRGHFMKAGKRCAPFAHQNACRVIVSIDDGREINRKRIFPIDLLQQREAARDEPPSLETLIDS